MMSLSNEERETLIRFDESTQIATVYTASYVMYRSLKKEGYPIVKKDASGWWFEIPVEDILFKHRNIVWIR